MTGISRRGFFRLALGATIVAGTAGSAIAGSILNNKTYAQKIADLIALTDKLIKIDEQVKVNVKPITSTLGQGRTYTYYDFNTWKAEAERQGVKASYDALFDEIFNYCRNNFALPGEAGSESYALAKESCSKVFNREFTGRWTDIPPTIHETIIPIAVIRYLLAHKSMRLDPTKMANFEWFADTYQDLILSA